MHCRWKIYTVVLGMALLILGVSCYQNLHEIAWVSFPLQGTASLYINGEESIPAFEPNVMSYSPASWKVGYPNTIAFGKDVKTVQTNRLRKGDYIAIKIGNIKYKLKLFPKTMPSYKILENKSQPGVLLFTGMESSCRYPSYAYAINTSGKLLYYRRNSKEKCLSDFKKTVLPDGTVLFSVMEQEFPPPPFKYWLGSLVIMDKYFNPLQRLQLLATDKHPTLGVENHDSLILGKDHFILSSYYHTETMVPGQEYPSRVAATVLQEIKDGKVLLDWKSTDYPQLYATCLGECSWQKVWYQDYLHFNSVVVDPNDNNLLLSFAGSSSIIKIDRHTGEILWTLGGLADDFNLTKDQLFVSQHSLSFLPSGELMLFDNHSAGLAFERGDLLQVPGIGERSRIVIFKLDEKKRKVINFRTINLPFISQFMGGVYTSPQGTFMVSYGSSSEMAVQEVDEKANILFSMSLWPPSRHTYRVYKYDSLE